MNSQDWDIKPRSDACKACSTAFVDRQPLLSALTFGDEGYTRCDYCESCWGREAEDVRAFSVWRSVFLVPPPPPEEPLKKETAESLLRRLMEGNDEQHTNVIFILAVMLERKRTLVEKDVRNDDEGCLIRVYEHRKSGETFLVPDPRLQLDEIEAVQEQVIEMLGVNEPPAPVPEPETPATATAESGTSAVPDDGLKGGFYSAETSPPGPD